MRPTGWLHRIRAALIHITRRPWTAGDDRTMRDWVRRVPEPAWTASGRRWQNGYPCWPI
jgi:hypothetical protein